MPRKLGTLPQTDSIRKIINEFGHGEGARTKIYATDRQVMRAIGEMVDSGDEAGAMSAAREFYGNNELAQAAVAAAREGDFRGPF